MTLGMNKIDRGKFEQTQSCDALLSGRAPN